MTIEERHERRIAYQAAQTMYRAFHERYYPVKSSGSRAALPLTDEASAELARLAAVVEEARLSLEAALRARG